MIEDEEWTGCFFFQAEDGIRDLVRSRGLGDVYKRQAQGKPEVQVLHAVQGQHRHTITRPHAQRLMQEGRGAIGLRVPGAIGDDGAFLVQGINPVSYTHLRAHETVLDIVCRLLLEKKTKLQHYPAQSAR